MRPMSQDTLAKNDCSETHMEDGDTKQMWYISITRGLRTDENPSQTMVDYLGMCSSVVEQRLAIVQSW